MKTTRRSFLSLAALAIGAGPPVQAFAQSYPSKSVRIIVPYSAASSSDNTARLFAEKLQGKLKQTFLVDNRPGAGGTSGVAATIKSPPDGYTLLMTTSSPLVISPSIDKTVSYDVAKDLVPVSLIATGGLLLVSSPEVPAKTLPELIAYLKKNPGKFSYASNGNGSYSHMAMELFKQATGVDLSHVPYRGPAQAETDVMGGQVLLMFDSTTTGSAMVKAGKLRAYGISSIGVDALVPEYKPLAAQGVPELKGFDVVGWTGLFAPRGTPAPVIDTLAGTMRELIADPAVRADMLQRNTALVAPERVGTMRQQIEGDTAKWAALIKAAHISLE